MNKGIDGLYNPLSIVIEVADRMTTKSLNSYFSKVRKVDGHSSAHDAIQLSLRLNLLSLSNLTTKL
jgi:hypothetical protein